MACGATVFFERSAEATRTTRADAILLDLGWYREVVRGEAGLTSEVPPERYVELLEAGLDILPEAESRLDDGDLVRLDVVQDGVSLGVIEISVTFEGEYVVSELVFAPRQPDLCQEPSG